MKKLLLIPSLFLFACVDKRGESLERQAVALEKISKSDTRPIDIDGEISIITIDSCEYVKYEGYNKGSVTHKGNCKNSIHWKTISR